MPPVTEFNCNLSKEKLNERTELINIPRIKGVLMFSMKIGEAVLALAFEKKKKYIVT